MGEQETSEQPTQVRYQVLAGLCVLGLIAYVHRVGFASSGTFLKDEFALSDPDWGNVMAAFLVAYAVFEVPWGLLGDKLGARHLLTLIALGWSALTAAVALIALLPRGTATEPALAAFWLLIALRFLFGAFQAGVFPAISRVVADWLPLEERATAQGFLWMACRLGGALAPFLMVGLISAFGGWEASLVLASFLGVAWCALFWPWFRNRPEHMRQVNAAELQRIAAGRGPRRAGHISWLKLFRLPSVWFLCLMYGFSGCSATFFITMLPDYLRKQRGLSPEQMQWLAGLPLAFGVAACLGGGLISDRFIRHTGNRRWGRRITGLVGHACAGVALLSTVWVHDVWALAALLSATFFFNDLAMGPAWASCADIGERYAGTLGGAMNTIGNLGGALGAVIAGSLLGSEFIPYLPGFSDYVVAGNELVFYIFAGSFWLGSLCWLGIDVTRPLTSVVDELGERPA
jgi:ACS family glucarate transporter-like MFS transporter